MKRSISFAGVLALALTAAGLSACVHESTDSDEEPIEAAEQAVLPSCTPNPCKNGGSCLFDAGANGNVCACPPGFLGEKCQYRDVCGANAGVCKNGGTCETIVPPPDGARPIACTCPPGFSGWDCSISECPCSQVDPKWRQAVKTGGTRSNPYLLEKHLAACASYPIAFDNDLMSVWVPWYSRSAAQSIGALLLFSFLFIPQTSPTYCALNTALFTQYNTLPGVVWSEANLLNVCVDGSSGLVLPVTPAENAACQAQIQAAPVSTAGGCGSGTVAPDLPLSIALGAPVLLGLAGLLRRRFGKKVAS